MKLVVALLAALSLVGCASLRIAEGPAKLGQTVRVDGPTVRPDRVIEDSRCPMNAWCVWAGRFILRATVAGGSWSRTIDLTLGEPVPVADGRLTLTSVTPDRVAGQTARHEPFRFAFRFQGGI